MAKRWRSRVCTNSTPSALAAVLAAQAVDDIVETEAFRNHCFAALEKEEKPHRLLNWWIQLFMISISVQTKVGKT